MLIIIREQYSPSCISMLRFVDKKTGPKDTNTSPTRAKAIHWYKPAKRKFQTTQTNRVVDQ